MRFARFGTRMAGGWTESGRVEIAAGELRNVDFLAMGGRDRRERTDYDGERDRRDFNRDQTGERGRPLPPPQPADRNKPPTF
jgi:hypothetical protein